MTPVMSAYAAAEREPLAAEAAGDLRRVTSLAITRTRPETAALVEVDVNEWQCPAGSMLKFAYDPSRAGFAHDVALDSSVPHATTRIFLPVFQGFLGVSVGGASAGCVAGIQRVMHPERFTLMPEVVLRPGWESRPLHQSLAGWGIEPPPDEF
jgi:hypothetical protein